jgi:catechol 2,3-dioxygenase-like lactoylglutathione lyase family enzyme
VDIAVVRVSSARLDDQRALFAGVLGLTVAGGSEGLRVHAGASTLVYEPGIPSPQHVAFRIPSASYADALAWLGARVELLAGDDGRAEVAFPAWNAHAMYFRDPDGNVLELIAHHDLPEPYTAPFGAGTLLGICEVGMPADDVAAFLARLESGAGIHRWSGDGVTFAAAGDKAGSLIVVPRGRSWHPVPSAEAVAGPLAIELADGTVVDV